MTKHLRDAGSVLLASATAMALPQDCNQNGIDPDLAELALIESTFGGGAMPAPISAVASFGELFVTVNDTGPSSGDLEVFDLSVPGSPVLVGSAPLNGWGSSVRISGNHAFVSMETSFVPAGLGVFDLRTPSTPVQVAEWTDEYLRALTLVGDRVFATSANEGLRVFDIADPQAPMLVGSLDFPLGTISTAIDVQGNVAVIANRGTGFLIVDVTQPTSPVLIENHVAGHDVYDVVRVGNLVYATTLGQFTSGLDVYDCSTAGATFRLGRLEFDTVNQLTGLIIEGQYAHAASNSGEAYTFDVRNPRSPRYVGTAPGVGGVSIGLALSGPRLVGTGNQYFAQRVAVADPSLSLEGQLAGVQLNGARFWVEGSTAWGSNGGGTIYSLNLTDPAAPRIVGTITLAGTGVYDFTPVGDVAYAVGDNALLVFDLSNRTCPSHVASVAFGSGPGALAVAGDLVYATSPTTGIQAFDVLNPFAPTPLPISTTAAGSPLDLGVFGNHVCVFADDALQIFDVSNPANAQAVGLIQDSPGTWLGGEFFGKWLIRRGAIDVQVYDLAVPFAPQPAGPAIALPSSTEGLCLWGSQALIPLDNGTWATVDFSIPTLPVLGTSIAATSGRASRFGHHAIVAANSGGVTIHRIAYPAAHDCANFGVPDACDIAGQVLADQNSNGIPDTCETGPITVCGAATPGPPVGVGSLAVGSNPHERVSLADDGSELTIPNSCKPSDPDACPAACPLTKNASHPRCSDDANVIAFTTEASATSQINPNSLVPCIQCDPLGLESCAMCVDPVANPLGNGTTLTTSCAPYKQVYVRVIDPGPGSDRTLLISGSLTAGPGNGMSNHGNGESDWGAVSGDGNSVLFRSEATDIPGDGPALNGQNYADIFVHDIPAGTTQRVTQTVADQVSANGPSNTQTAISAKGRFIAFSSRATNLASASNGLTPDGAYFEVFLLDRGTDLVSASDDSMSWVTAGRDSLGNAVVSDGSSEFPSMSQDGCRIVFQSRATNLRPGVTLGASKSRIWCYDRSADELWLVDDPQSVCANVTPTTPDLFNGQSRRPVISADGRWAVFESGANNLVLGSSGSPPVVTLDDDGTYDVFVANLDTGAVVELDHGLADDRSYVHPQLSGNGRFVLFTRAGAAGENTFSIFICDRDADGNGVLDEPGGLATELIDDPLSGVANELVGGNAQLSLDGAWAVYMSEASNLVPGDTNGGVPDGNGGGCDSQPCCFGDPLKCPPTANNPCPGRWGRDVFRRRLWQP